MKYLFAALCVLFLVGCSPEPLPTETQPTTETPTAPAAELAGCDALPNKLESCEPFTCTFNHPLTGEILSKGVTGLESGSCAYEEQMPNNGLMTCHYSEETRTAVAQYYRDLASASSTTMEMGPQGTTYTIDGQEVENPLEEAMNNGDCIITGYD